jgi:hypothetical protein
MATTIRKTAKKSLQKKGVVASKVFRDYSNDPFFEKKAKEMETLIKKHGLPPIPKGQSSKNSIAR